MGKPSRSPRKKHWERFRTHRKSRRQLQKQKYQLIIDEKDRQIEKAQQELQEIKTKLEEQAKRERLAKKRETEENEKQDDEKRDKGKSKDGKRGLEVGQREEYCSII
ncbi:hypothetical protein C1645_828177 [Glomus cerebriforme]|uniref:Uncharacterized protein n=1 Tax=Glomus cerebriforme TaxID=658196 RepID=A0A397ST81_9GLOM|nr:hypothetical protein C1645_828177 [Glomus cerebriforme]